MIPARDKSGVPIYGALPVFPEQLRVGAEQGAGAFTNRWKTHGCPPGG